MRNGEHEQREPGSGTGSVHVMHFHIRSNSRCISGDIADKKKIKILLPLQQEMQRPQKGRVEEANLDLS